MFGLLNAGSSIAKEYALLELGLANVIARILINKSQSGLKLP